ncbi:hypothetical protein PDIP_33380 [Penicillium digitatum Pd1]|uniref:Uncharacterized protein n=1 Tax=Penicillium digitatum (strain Pd1 / CECT 20795) TaxID=1170230 RepID=K9GV53_PEND1|nr:hypothetical protein PDIP_33380 [Penicillium digitatum Pd1]EKV16971.1 hypothetical protein PDIP_33380 [Penicillium digitatum Pd1]
MQLCSLLSWRCWGRCYQPDAEWHGVGLVLCFLGLVMAAGLGLLWVENVYGMGWREKRLLKIERKKVEKEARAAEIQVERNSDEREQKDTHVAGAKAGVTERTDTFLNQ